jgi:RNA polymerase primary sigma factor
MTDQVTIEKTAAESATPPPSVPATVRAKLNETEWVALDRVLTTPEDYIDHPDLHAKDADVTLFGVTARRVSADVSRFPAPQRVINARVLAGTRVPTLKVDQERTLFLRLNYIRMRIQTILQEHAGNPLKLTVARDLIAWGHWELETRARIVELNMPLVLAMAKRTRLAGVDYNEMISEGNMALLRSVNKFDCGRGFKFSTYACRAILKSFSRVAMRTSRYRGTFPVEFDPSVERSDHLERKRDGVEADCVDDLKMILAKNAADLTAVEETVIRERFALDHLPNEIPVPKTLEQVGKIIGVTKERVRQIQNKALKKIRSALEDSMAA